MSQDHIRTVRISPWTRVNTSGDTRHFSTFDDYWLWGLPPFAHVQGF